jgi:exodeoxyribonuclease VII small subunit
MTENEGESFEQALERAESIARELEEGDLTLEQSLAKYEEGVRALKECYRILRKAEKRIEVLVKDEEGNLRTEPFRADDDSGRDQAR